ASGYYHFVTGYRLYVGVPNENGEIEYICFAQTDYYGDGTEPYNNAQDLIFDTSAAKLVALGLETLDGVYEAYVVMDYQSIVNENVDDQFTVKRGAFEGHHFALTVVAPCEHEHVTATYTFGNDETYGAYIMIANKCDICEENLAGAYIWVYRTGEADGLPLISQAATCTEDGMSAHKHFTLGGYDKYYVEDTANHWVECDDPSTLVIKAGHIYQAVTAVAATCTTDGNHAHFECSVCHKKFVQDETEYYEVEPESLVIDAFHKHLEAVGEVPATCSAYGVQAYYTCSQCGKSFTDALGEHEIADLNAWKIGDGKIDKLAHNWQWIVDTAATKTATGIKHEECSVCHERRSENTVIPMQDCDHEHVTLTAQVDPTCTQAGKKAYYHCTDCDKYFEDAACQLQISDLASYGVLNALGHEWGEWQVVTPATETQEGLERRVCSRDANHVDERSIPMIGHVHSIQAVAAKAATCTQAGNSAYWYCTSCEKYFSDAEGNTEIELEATVIPATGHTPSDWIVTTPATCTAAGSKHKTCTVCGTELQVEEIPALGHDYGEWTVTTPAQVGVAGEETRVCSRDANHKETRPIDAIPYPHREDGGVNVYEATATAGQAKDVETLFEQAKADNGKVELTVGTLVITFNADAVNAIGGNAASLTANVITSGFDIEGAQLIVEVNFTGSAFANGRATISVPFTTAVPEGKVAKVYYVNGNEKTDMNAVFADGKVTFDTNHFSRFAVVFENEQQDNPVNPQPSDPAVNPSPEKKGLSGGAIAGIVIGSVFGALLIACVVLFLLNKKGVVKLGKKD
ncbi:MAG: hypothetical protein IJT69_03540, partial [Clostridia bacterium]|nr:hypothetical protein [Clostridia bacterium]